MSFLKILPHAVGQYNLWDSARILADCLLLLADVDDIQSAVCILIVLGERRKDIPIDDLVHVSVQPHTGWSLVFSFIYRSISIVLTYRSTGF